MVTLSISLQEWILVFSANYESTFSSAGKIQKEAQLAHVERAIRLALVLLDVLNHALNEAASASGSVIDPDQIRNVQ